MLQSLRNRKKGQNTAEYAILIALVIGAVVAMQSYAQRALQGRIRDAAMTLVNATNNLGTTNQYEPYYQNTTAQIARDSNAEDTYKNHWQKTTTNTSSQVERTEYPATLETGI